MTALLEEAPRAWSPAMGTATVKVADLRKALSTVASGKRVPWNLLRVGVSHLGSLSVSGSDPTFDTFTRATLGTNVGTWRYVVVDADMMRRSLRGAKGTITVQVHDRRLDIGYVTIDASPHASEFPSESWVPGVVVHKSAADLAWLATGAATSKTNTSTGPVLESVVISEGDIATCNRYQLHAVLTTPAVDSVLVHVKALTTMLKGKPEAVRFTYAAGGDARRVGVSYTAGTLTVVGSVAATIGNFPKWRDLIPQRAGTRACVPAAQLRAAVADVGAVLDRNRPVRLVFADGAIRVHSGSPEDGPYAERVVPLSNSTHDTFEVAFNPVFLANVLAGFDGDAWMASDDPKVKPSVFTDDTDRVGLIMPVKI